MDMSNVNVSTKDVLNVPKKVSKKVYALNVIQIIIEK